MASGFPLHFGECVLSEEQYLVRQGDPFYENTVGIEASVSITPKPPRAEAGWAAGSSRH